MGRDARLIRVVRLSEALSNLPERSLFHAGPPYSSQPSGAVLNAAAQAAMLEGWAADLETARQAIIDPTSDIQLRPAQDIGLVVPLAQVASPSTWCVEVGDAQYRAYSPVSDGPPPALRFGSIDPICQERARDWCAQVAKHLNPLLNQTDVHPESLMRQAHASGDDGHAQTQAGTQLLIDSLTGLPEALKQEILNNSSFALTTWMAYCSWKLRSVDSKIVAIGGNGNEFGVKLKGKDSWSTVSATPPIGFYFKPEFAHESLGAIGDSAVIDACGFGGQALINAPTLLQEWSSYLPDDATTRPQLILDPKTGCIDPSRILDTGLTPIINLAILHRDGGDAPIGRGHYCPPIELFNSVE